ncbi:MAG: hypothetical protein R2764_18315 [Bacteroidales bacterium]
MGQSLVMYYEGVMLAENEEITISAHPDSGLMVAEHIDVENISNDSIFVLCVRNIIENVENTTNTFAGDNVIRPILIHPHL